MLCITLLEKQIFQVIVIPAHGELEILATQTPT